jgi:hypothetical protein
MHAYASRVGRWSLAFSFVGVLVSGAACAHPTRGSTSRPSALQSSLAYRETQLRSTNHTITAAELGAFRANSVYELVTHLRPQFLRSDHTAPRGSAEPTVYIDDLLAGPVSVLRSIPVDDVAEIHYVTAVDAFMLHGSKQPGGIISVRLRRR